MERKKQQFIERLSVGPSFLLLGQSAAADAGGFDSVIVASADKASVTRAARVSVVAASERRVVFDRLAEASRTAAIPPSLSQSQRFGGMVCSLPWLIAAYTWAFAAQWRRVTTSVGDQRVRHPWSSIDLSIRLLFGGTGEPPDRWPPTTVLEMAARRSTATQALAELTSDLITPRGRISNRRMGIGDGLSSEALYAAVTRRKPEQAHLFSATAEVLQDEFIAGAIAQGFLVPHVESLASLLSAALQEGRLIQLDEEVDASTRVLYWTIASFRFLGDQWSRIITSARPIDAELISPPAPLPSGLEYERFRPSSVTPREAPTGSESQPGTHFDATSKWSCSTECSADSATQNSDPRSSWRARQAPEKYRS